MFFGDPLDLADFLPRVAPALAPALPAPAAVGADTPPAVPAAEPDAPPAAPPADQAIVVADGGFRNRPQNSGARMAKAREQFMKNAAVRREKKLHEKLRQKDKQLQVALTLSPAARDIIGSGSSSSIGRRKDATQEDFIPLVHACHITLKSKPNVGIDQRRLHKLASNTVLVRQEEGLKTMLDNAASDRTHLGVDDRTTSWVHCTMDHMWDGVNLHYRQMARSRRSRLPKTNIRQEILMQRGAVITATANLGGETEQKPLIHAEPWIAQPKIVDGTAAEHIANAIEDGQPKATSFKDLDATIHACGCVDSMTINKAVDKGPGNLLYLKMYAATYEEVVAPRVPNLLLNIECCNSHVQHRGKKTIPGLKDATLRLYGGAKLSKKQSTQQQIQAFVDWAGRNKIMRVVGPPPAPDSLRGSFLIAAKILYKDYDAEQDKRSNQFIEDVMRLAVFANGELQDEYLVHHCWDAERQCPCCRDDEETAEKGTRYCNDALFSRADDLPAESTWTHVRKALKMTILRRMAWNIGLDAFTIGVKEIDHAPTIVVDGEAVENPIYKIDNTRLMRLCEFFRDRKKQDDMIVMAALVDLYDSKLLYPILGDPLRDASQVSSKLPLLIDYEKGLVAEFQQSLRSCLIMWRQGDPARVPWGLASALGAPLQDQGYMRRSRSKMARLGSAAFRMFEVKYSSVSYTIYFSACDYDLMPETVLDEIIRAFLEAPDIELEIWARGFRRMFPTRLALMSRRARLMLRADFQSRSISTDAVERLNSIMNQGFPPGAPGRNFVYHAREVVLQQIDIAHRARGGEPPLRPRKCFETGQQETDCVNPLLVAPLRDRGGAEESGGDANRGDLAVGEGAALVEAGARGGQIVAVGDGGLDQYIDSTTVSGQWQHAECKVAPSMQTSLVAVRPVETFVGSGPEERDEPPKARRGLSPFLLERNTFMEALRTAHAAPISETQIVNAHERFKQQWNAMPDHKVYEDLYQLWRNGGSKDDQEQLAVKDPYRPIWAGGTVKTPLGSSELHSSWRSRGWPSDEATHDGDGTEAHGEADFSIDFAAYKNFSLFGSGQWARNISRDKVLNPAQFTMVESGVHAYIRSLGADVADAGDVMICISG